LTGEETLVLRRCEALVRVYYSLIVHAPRICFKLKIKLKIRLETDKNQETVKLYQITHSINVPQDTLTKNLLVDK